MQTRLSSREAVSGPRYNGLVRSGLWVAAFMLSYMLIALVALFQSGIEAFLGVMLAGALVEACIAFATWSKTEREKGRAAK